MRAAAFCACSVLATNPLPAQQPSLATVPRVGQLVRFQPVEGVKVEGRVARLDRDTIVVRTGHQEFHLGQAQLIGARLATGTQSAVFRGMGTGALVGTGLGLVLGAIAESQDDCGSGCAYEGMALSGGAVLGAIAGSLIGVVAGSLGSTPRWSRVALPGPAPASLTADLVPGDGVRIAAAASRPAGIIVGGMGDTARVRLDTGEEILVPVASLERYAGEKSRGGTGLLIGGAVGIVLGVATYAAEDDGWTRPTTAETIAGVAFSGWTFALIGALVTKGTKPTWAGVTPTPGRALTLHPNLGARGVGVVVNLRL